MLSTAFRQNLLASMEASALHLTALAELAGAGPEQIATPRRAAADRGPDGYLIALSSPTSQPLLATLRDRETRRRLFEASAGRATAGEHDNRPVAVQIAQLRARRAELLGFPTHAAATLADTAAGTTEAVDALLAQLVAPAVANAPARRRSLPSVPPGTGSASQRRGIGPITPRSCAPSGTASTRRRCDRTSSSTPPSPTEAQAIRDAQQWGEGFRTVEYLAATLLDQAWHRLAPAPS